MLHTSVKWSPVMFISSETSGTELNMRITRVRLLCCLASLTCWNSPWASGRLRKLSALVALSKWRLKYPDAARDKMLIILQSICPEVRRSMNDRHTNGILLHIRHVFKVCTNLTLVWVLDDSSYSHFVYLGNYSSNPSSGSRNMFRVISSWYLVLQNNVINMHSYPDFCQDEHIFVLCRDEHHDR